MKVDIAQFVEKEEKKVVEGPHIIVKALAGTGKTTTSIEGVREVLAQSGSPLLRSTLSPSLQQAKVWECMKLSDSAKTICCVAFNKSIATELQKRVPEGVVASTMHSMGFKSVREQFGRVKVTSWRTQNLIGKILNKDTREIRRTQSGRTLLDATDKLVGLCKQNLVGSPIVTGFHLHKGVEEELEEKTLFPATQELDQAYWYEELNRLSAHYDVDLNGNRDEIYSLVPKVLEAARNVQDDKEVDFNDMIWLPVVLGLKVTLYDILIVDEAQDLNRAQQLLATKAGERLILVGDENQAIYGFAGADCESIDRMEEYFSHTDRGVEVLPLTVTRRCGKAIVREAQTLVPEFEAHEDNPEGEVLQSIIDEGPNCYRNRVKSGDMILCRVNAPLVQQCFRFLKEGRKATIQGRDIGAGLKNTLKKLNAKSVDQLITKLDKWYDNETSKENKKKNPSEAKLIALQDRYECLQVFIEGAFEVKDVLDGIDKVFSDEAGEGIKLSSAHKSKGLEADTVWILSGEVGPMPHPLAVSEWQRKQEYNLKYVAITRAINTLVWVS